MDTLSKPIVSRRSFTFHLTMNDQIRIVLSMVFLFHLGFCASDEECDKCVSIIPCYQCSTLVKGEEYCEDPFNLSHHSVRKVSCKGVCVKWVIKPKADKDFTHVVRGCYNDLDITFPAAMVCMGESRPGYGHLCFCDTELCNGANSLMGHKMTRFLTLMVTSFVTLWFLSQYMECETLTIIYRFASSSVSLILPSWICMTFMTMSVVSPTATFRDDG